MFIKLQNDNWFNTSKYFWKYFIQPILLPEFKILIIKQTKS